jgi:uncharacterized protein DUF6152
MRARLAALVACAGLLWVATPVEAHHSFRAEYDEEHPVTLKGKVTKVTWNNPHVLFYLDVPNTTGKVTKWELEMGSPNLLLSQGWTLDSVRTGDVVTVEGFPAKNGAKIANARKVILATR